MHELVVCRLVHLPSSDREHVLLGDDLDLLRPEAGNRQGDLEVAVVELLQIEGRIRFGRVLRRRVHEVKEPVEPDGGTAKRRKVEEVYSSHSSLLSMNMVVGAPAS